MHNYTHNKSQVGAMLNAHKSAWQSAAAVPMRDFNELLLYVFPIWAHTHKTGMMLLRAHIVLAGVSLRTACFLELSISGRYIGLGPAEQQY